MRAVLMPLVAMQHQTIRLLFSLQGIFHGLLHKPNVIFAAETIADDEAIVEVLDYGQIAPVLAGAHISDVRNPFLIGPVS